MPAKLRKRTLPDTSESDSRSTKRLKVEEVDAKKNKKKHHVELNGKAFKQNSTYFLKINIPLIVCNSL